MTPWLPAVASALMLAVVTPPTTDRLDCASARQSYREVEKKLADALRSYTRCVATSQGKDKCEAEMQALDDTHDDFEDAIDDIAEACP